MIAKTLNDIRIFDPTVEEHVQQYNKGLCTKEEMLEKLAIQLAVEKEGFERKYVTLLNEQPDRILFGDNHS